MKLNAGIHLAYCTNVHRGETWAETFAALERHVLPVRRRVAPGRSYAIGLRLSQRAAAELAQGDALVTYDADLPYPLEDLPAMLAALLAGADVVTASPWHPAGSAQVSWWRAALSRTISKLYRLRLGRRAQGLHTFTCGYRVWRAATYRASLPTRDGFVATAEMLLRALRSGARAVELPSALRPRLEGVSKLRVLRTACAHLRLLLRG